MRKIKFILALSLLTISLAGYAQGGDQGCKTAAKTVKGTYRGNNLFFQNNLSNGIQKIYLNGKEVVSACTSTAFELPLSGLKPGQKFELKIVYCAGSKDPYKILNLEVVK